MGAVKGPEEEVLPTGREFDPVVDERRRMRMEEWSEEVRAANEN
jgi:hypothetical protein